MAMKVPTYQEKVSPIAPQIQAPRMPRTRMPQISTPRVIPGAFGVDAARATQELAQAGEKIATHLQKLAQDEQDKEIIKRETSFRQDMQDALVNQEDETIQINGQDITRKKGFLLRQLSQAKGATEEFDQIYQTQLRNKYTEGLTEYQAEKLLPAMDRHYLTARNSLITHEANQLDEDFKNATEANLKQKVLDASIIRDQDQLKIAIQDAIEIAEPYNRKYDKATRKILNEEVAANIIEASAIAALQSTGNLPFAETLVDSAKDKIARATYNDIKSKLAKGDKSMKAEAERIETLTKVNNRFDYISKIADGTLDWANSSDIIREVSMTDPKLAEAMTKNIKRGGFEIEEKDEVFMDLAQEIFKSADSETISDFLVAALSETTTISRDRLAVLVYAARKRAEELNKGESRGFLESIVNAIAINFLLPAIAADILLKTLKRIQTENANDKRILDIANEEIQKERLKENPIVSTNDEKGTEMEDAFGNRAIVFPDGRIEEIK